MFETLFCEMIGAFVRYRPERTLDDVGSVAEVHTDADGIDSRSLRNILDSWPSSKPKPKILYTIPVRVLFYPPT